MPQNPGPRVDRLRQSALVFEQRAEALEVRKREQIAAFRASVDAEVTELRKKARILRKTIAMWEHAEAPRRKSRAESDAELEHVPGDHGAQLAAALADEAEATPALPTAPTKAKKHRGRPPKKRR